MEKSKGKAGTDQKSEGDSMFTQATNTMQDLEESMAKSALNFTKAISNGLNTYLEARQESANAKENGPMQDMFVNVAKGVTATVKDASNIITDTAEALDKAGFSPKMGERVSKAVGDAVDSVRNRSKE